MDPRRKLAFWNDRVSESLTPLISEPVDVRDFNGSISQVSIDDMSLAEVYSDAPELAEKADVPKGKLTPQKPWESKIFPNTTRPWWIYVPAQYKDDQPACVMVFQDGKLTSPDGLAVTSGEVQAIQLRQQQLAHYQAQERLWKSKANQPVEDGAQALKQIRA